MQTLSQVQEYLRFRFGEHMEINTPAEQNTIDKAIGMEEDWETGDYLVVVGKSEEYDVIRGAYVIEYDAGILNMQWQPYPDPPYKGLAKIEHCLKKCIEEHN